MYTAGIRELHPGRRLSTPEEAWSRGRHDVGVHFFNRKKCDKKSHPKEKKLQKKKRHLQSKNICFDQN